MHTNTDMCNDLSTLYERLFPARTEWFNIGLKLKLTDEALKEIELQHNDSKICLRNMLIHRLHVIGPLSWRKVCACLQCPIVGREDVVKDIYKWIKGIQQLTILIQKLISLQ